MDINRDQLQKILWLRAIEWCAFPSFVSQPIVPILFIFFPILWVIIIILLLELLWSLVKYKYVNFTISQYAAVFVVKTKWPLTIIAVIVLVIMKDDVKSIVALFWPFIAGFVHIPGGKSGIIELNLAKQIGYVDQESQI